MPSSAEREKVARAGFEAFSARDPRTILTLLADDVEVSASPEMPNAGSFHGHDGYLEWIRPWTEGRGRGGIEVSMDPAFLFDVNDEGLCSYLAMLPTVEEAREMAEAREDL